MLSAVLDALGEAWSAADVNQLVRKVARPVGYLQENSVVTMATTVMPSQTTAEAFAPPAVPFGTFAAPSSAPAHIPTLRLLDNGSRGLRRLQCRTGHCRRNGDGTG